MLLIACFTFHPFAFSQDAIQEQLKEEARKYREEGYRLQSIGEAKGALTYYQKAAGIYPQYTEVYNDIGVIYESFGNSAKALKMYKKALDIDPGYLAACTNIALLYEKMGKVRKAGRYWIRRYRHGKKGEYWREMARQRLLESGLYPEVHQEMLEEEAAILSRELVYVREQKRLKTIEEVRLHFNIALALFEKGELKEALKELETALSLKPRDKELQMEVAGFYTKVKRLYKKDQLRKYVDEAVMHAEEDNYTFASQSLRKALSIISSFSE